MESAERLKPSIIRTDSEILPSSRMGDLERRVSLNTAGREIAKTVLAGYYKYGVQTLLTGNFGTTGTMILEVYGEDSQDR